MTRRAKLWWGGAAVYAIVNIVGFVSAALSGEGMHAETHAVLLLVGAVVAWGVTLRIRRQERLSARLPPAPARLDTLQQSVDAIAIELERLGEAQRYRDKLEAQRKEPER
jgi:hypothetical protein